MLVRLLYASRAVEPHNTQVTDAILAQSRTHNPACGITGILCYGDGIFLQALEGGRNAVNELYAHILRDTRHKDVVLLRYEEISERNFGSWTMGLVNIAKLNTSILLKYSERAGPWAWSISPSSTPPSCSNTLSDLNSTPIRSPVTSPWLCCRS